MKKALFLFASLISIAAWAQDSSEVAERPKCNLGHEIGANTTLLLKQVFNLSNSTFTTLPYNLTYKLIWKDIAFRTGVGFTRSTSKTEETETRVTTGNAAPVMAGPDKMVPTVNNTYSFSYRTGIEYRKTFNKIAAYAGLDFVTDYFNSHSQSSSEFNNLPNSYNYFKTTNDVTLLSYGAGPVAGLHFFPTKRIGIFTELPIYFVSGKQKDISESYQNNGQMNFFTGKITYTATTVKNTEETTLSGLRIILPVTLYLSFSF